MALLYQNGKNKSVRTEVEELELLKNDLDALTPEERILLDDVLRDLEATGSSPLADEISKLSYDAPLASIEEFVSSKYYLGELADSLFPKLKQDVIDLFSGDYDTAMFGGSLGAGKSTVAVVTFLRVLYEISMLSNPHKTFGIAPNDNIGFAVVAVNQFVAQGIIDSKISRIIDDSPYFSTKFRPISKKEGGIYFPKNIVLLPGISTETGGIGANVICVMMDEVNFFKTVDGNEGVKDYAYEIYKSFKTRMESRFRGRGKLPGMMVLVSSKKSVNSLTERVMKENIDNKRFYVVENATYEVVPQERFSGDVFRVAVGTENAMSRILGDNEPDPESMLVVKVPVEYKSSFETDIDRALRDISGIATVSVTPFISRRDKIIESIDPNRNHPFEYYIWQQDVPAKWKWEEICTKNYDGSWSPKINPSAPRFIHLDMSKNKDLTGLSMVHVGGGKEVLRGGRSETVPHFVVDFVLGIQAPPTGEIYQHEVRRLIYELAEHGFFIKKVTADTFQSLGTLQALKTQGFETDTVSVDKVGPYDYFKSALYEDRVSYYRHHLLLKELRELERSSKTGKVDHPTPGSKDLADAVCGAVFALSQSSLSMAIQSSYEPKRSDYVDDENWVLGSDIPVDKSVQSGKDNSAVPGRKKFDLPFVMG